MLYQSLRDLRVPSSGQILLLNGKIVSARMTAKGKKNKGVSVEAQPAN
jgi:hypothetical protein